MTPVVLFVASLFLLEPPPVEAPRPPQIVGDTERTPFGYKPRRVRRHGVWFFLDAKRGGYWAYVTVLPPEGIAPRANP